MAVVVAMLFALLRASRDPSLPNSQIFIKPMTLGSGAARIPGNGDHQRSINPENGHGTREVNRANAEANNMDAISFITGIAGLMIGVPSLFGLTISIKKRYPWKTIMKGIEEVSTQIQHQAPKPDAIVALGDGAVPAAVLALNLGIKLLYFIDSPTTGRSQAGAPTLDASGLPSTLKGHRVIIVDNHIFTGANMAAAVKIVRGLDPDDIKTCAIFCFDSKSTLLSPDYRYATFGDQRIPIPWGYSKLHSDNYVSSVHSRAR